MEGRAADAAEQDRLMVVQTAQGFRCSSARGPIPQIEDGAGVAARREAHMKEGTARRGPGAVQRPSSGTTAAGAAPPAPPVASRPEYAGAVLAFGGRPTHRHILVASIHENEYAPPR